MGGGSSILVTPTWNLAWTFKPTPLSWKCEVLPGKSPVFYPPEKQYWTRISPMQSETNIKRQATRQDCLPSLLGDGDKVSEIVCGEDSIYVLLGWLEQPRQDKNLFYQHNEPNEPTSEGHLSYVLLESQFSSVSTVNRGHPSLVSMIPRFLLLATVGLVSWKHALNINTNIK
jgi:hypothetical protein